MTGRVRNHRRVGAVELVAGLVAILGCCIGWAFVLTALKALAIRWPVAAGVVLAAGIGYLVCRRQWCRRREARARREMAEWRASSGWTEVPLRAGWPWTPLQRWREVVTVQSAHSRTVGGFPVTVGQISWTEDGLGRTVDRHAGSGLFVLVRLPQPVPSMAVRGYPHVPRRRRGEDEFRRRFETVGFDSYRLDGPAFREAHVRGDVPLWTVIDRDLFAFVPLDVPVTPGAIDSAVRRTLRVVELMELGPDGVTPPDDDMPPLDMPPDDMPPDEMPPPDDVPPDDDVPSLEVPPLSVEPLGAEPLDVPPLGVEPLGAEPLDVPPLSAEPLGAEPLDVPPPSAEPLGAEPLGATPLGAEPLGATPLGAEPLGATPLEGDAVGSPRAG